MQDIDKELKEQYLIIENAGTDKSLELHEHIYHRLYDLHKKVITTNKAL